MNSKASFGNLFASELTGVHTFRCAGLFPCLRQDNSTRQFRFTPFAELESHYNLQFRPSGLQAIRFARRIGVSQ
jgi:hypothetical protein